jgi:glucokinase-like ROK family protein
MRTGDQAFIKELNKSITMNLIREKSPISRTQISSESGLNKATVSSLIDELISEGLVVELGPGHSSVGRRPVMLGFNGNAGYAIGVELGVDYIRVLAMNLAGEVTSFKEIPLSSSETTAKDTAHTITSTGTSTNTSTTNVLDVVKSIADCITDITSNLPSSSVGIIGVGIGVPGLVDFSQGIVLNAPNLQWEDVPLRAYLEANIHLPIFIDNEANAGALAEQLFGKGKDVSDFVYLSIGTGIGTGIIVNGNLVRGNEGTAGEFGHMVIEAQGLRCSCGNRGCLEMYASEKALVTKYKQISGLFRTGKEIISELSSGDSSALEAIQSIGQYLGTGIHNIINGLNPALIVIGNRMSEADDWLLRPIEQVIRNSGSKFYRSKVKVETSSLGRNATARGAASLIINQYFSGPIE